MKLNLVRRFQMGNAFLFLSLVLCSSASVSTTNVRRLFHTPQTSESVCKIREDFSTIATTLRTLILTAETKAAATVLSGNQTFSFGTGLTFLEEQRCAVVRTEDPTRDPDIVAIQAIALSAKRNGEAEKLANAIVLSFESDCECDSLSPEEKDRLAGAFRGFLEDPETIEYILNFGRSENETRSSSAHPRRRGRSLLNDQNNAFTCQLCDPPDICIPTVHWCN